VTSSRNRISVAGTLRMPLMNLLSSNDLPRQMGCRRGSVRPRLDLANCVDNHNYAHKVRAFLSVVSPTTRRPAGQHGAVHELALCQAIAGVVRSHAGDRRVDVVRVRVGALRQVVPESLEFCWSLVREYENMAAAELELEVVTGEVVCRNCRERSQIESRWSVCCPRCESADVEVVRGNEFLVTSLDVT
jgi:hydrogenase nickel insertion protein HypA